MRSSDETSFGVASGEAFRSIAEQLLVGAGMACSGIYYLTMFAVVLWGRLDGEHAPLWLKIGACTAAGVTVLSVVLQVVPILDVAQPGLFATKVGGGVLLINAAGVWVYRWGSVA